MRFHIVAALYALYFSRFYDLLKVEKAILFFTIGFVLAMELLNTAVEHTVNLVVNDQYHSVAKLAKDAAAGAVLAAAICSILIGICLFADNKVLKEIWQYHFKNWYRGSLLLGSVVAGAWFIFYIPNLKKGTVK